MSAQFQVTLNEAAGTKQEPVTKRWKNDNVSEEPAQSSKSGQPQAD